MNRSPLLALLASFALAGCSQSDPNMADYVKAGVETREEAKEMSVSLIAQNLLQQFRATQGRNPESVEDLEAKVGKLPSLPAGQHYEIDPGSGSLSIAAD